MDRGTVSSNSNLQCASVLRMLRESLHALTKCSEVGSNLTVNSACGN